MLEIAVNCGRKCEVSMVASLEWVNKDGKLCGPIHFTTRQQAERLAAIVLLAFDAQSTTVIGDGPSCPDAAMVLGFNDTMNCGGSH